MFKFQEEVIGGPVSPVTPSLGTVAGDVAVANIGQVKVKNRRKKTPIVRRTKSYKEIFKEEIQTNC